MNKVELSDNKYWDVIIDAMIGVTSNPLGTGYRAFNNFPYKVAGKTGTAQVIAKKHRDNEPDHDTQEEYLPEHLRNHRYL